LFDQIHVKKSTFFSFLLKVMKGREKGRKRMLKREVMLGEVLEVLMGGLRGLASVSSPSTFFVCSNWWSSKICREE